ncbi:heme transporter hrg1-A-like isoform X2 [Babylonia areolata]|uniref:heme transporter hrg1-A-like isoform X2 n=1 Tax=Babylonia areolata TaxID=304850 RepID=UPI003FCF3D84
MSSPSDCSMGARIVFAVVGVVLGVCVAGVFGGVYHNFNAAAWGFVSGVVAALTLYVHVQYVKGKYRADPRALRVWLYCGCWWQLVGLVSLVVYIVLAIRDRQGLVIYGEGFYVASVWSFMTLKWGFQLLFFSRTYWRRIVNDLQLLPHPEKASPEENCGSQDDSGWGV